MSRATSSATSDEVDLADFEPQSDRFLADVVAGLSADPKTLPTQYLYDERGSELFEQICELPEYYPTRTELAIFEAHIDEMAARIGPDAMVIEYGSGAGVKPRILLRALQRPVAYVPVEISRAHLLRSAEALAAEFPAVEVLPVCADFTQPFEVPEATRRARRRVVFFPGSTIGNFEPHDAARLLRQMGEEVGPGGGMLVGVDLRKDPQILERAYDDAAGVTAAFNLNLLHRINRELGATIDVEAFVHRAPYDPEHGRIAMLLVSTRDQVVTVGRHRFSMAAGEAIRTEFSHKYTLEGFGAMARRAGLAIEQAWTDPQRLFSVVYLRVSA